MIEEWKKIEGYEGKYEVSNFGNVRKLGWTDSRGRYFGPKILNQNILKRYYAVALNFNEIQKRIHVHRLVALTFIPNPENKPQVNHIDGNRLNNKLDNLEWNTASENQLHALRLGLAKCPPGAQSSGFKGFIEVYRNGILIDKLEGRTDMINKGYNPNHVYDCVLYPFNPTGSIRTHLGCTYKRI